MAESSTDNESVREESTLISEEGVSRRRKVKFLTFKVRKST